MWGFYGLGVYLFFNFVNVVQVFRSYTAKMRKGSTEIHKEKLATLLRGHKAVWLWILKVEIIHATIGYSFVVSRQGCNLI
ncbi:hypothetical protein Q765_20430 [Flavobacterium rivuli WB 3.3-2 = DSM 21788]|uniref:Uncharacterized protein n=1 Tax=Flavobacterium rivuli WB 3.3-2 = DSM 21788 TaxID=1121895 RepID=A0A0A2LXI3_9FLAO|nr:hypothetical protein Q765_20430 [Flavobacterium rivuli WB 3.3-2 = DSM 21788]